MIRNTLTRLVLSGLVLSAALSVTPPASGTGPAAAPVAVAAPAGQGYMVHYKKPSWRYWKSCGPYGYGKACQVAKGLKNQGCMVSIEEAD